MHRLIYKSRAKGTIDKETFRDILYSSASANRSQGLNGALLATRTHYLQFLEGEYSRIQQTFKKISADPRHCDIQVISFDAIDSCLFENWHMRGFGVFQSNLELEARLKEKYGAHAGGIKMPSDEQTAISLAHDIKTSR